MDIVSLYDKFLSSGGISTDTRQIGPNSIFFALKGPRFNANEFAAEALERGARFAVVDDEQYLKDDRYIFAGDTLLALQELAAHHRTKLKIPVLGLTGSNGKTTSKELINSVLSKKFKTSATQGNLNNHIGVPLTILKIGSEVELAVIEMGANHVGEIAALCELARPTHGLITNIGKAHIGTFGGAENILRAKTELFQFLREHNGTVFINSADPVLNNLAKRFASPVRYPASGDYYHCELVDTDPVVSVLAEDGSRVSSQLTGKYNFDNIAAALCIGKYFGVPATDGNAGIAEYVPGNMRSQIILKGTNRILLDAYNANPSSMEAAVENLATLKGARKVAVLGDMYELGTEEDEEHRNLGRFLKTSGIEEVYLCGKLTRAALETFPSAKYFETVEELLTYLRIHPIENATILVKASRGMRLEKVVEGL